MRVSTQEDDKGYANFIAAGGYHANWTITLDGEDLSNNCITADDEMGLVIVADRDNNGMIQSVDAKILTIVKYGKVVIVNGLVGQSSTALSPAL